MQHIEPHIQEVRRAVQALNLEVPEAVANDVKAKVENLISRLEAYQSAIELLLAAFVQEGVKPDCTPDFRALADSANHMRRQPANLPNPFNGHGPTVVGFYWCVHKTTGKVTVGELVKDDQGFVFHYPIVSSIRQDAFKDYYWVGPVSQHIKL
jgi:hypothetical protein